MTTETTTLNAWATTSETDPSMDAGIAIISETVAVDEQGNRDVLDNHYVVESEAQVPGWGVDGDYPDRGAFDELLTEMGYRRVGEWERSSVGYAAQVERHPYDAMLDEQA